MNKPGAGVPWDPGAGGTPRAGSSPRGYGSPWGGARPCQGHCVRWRRAWGCLRVVRGRRRGEASRAGRVPNRKARSGLAPSARRVRSAGRSGARGRAGEGWRRRGAGSRATRTSERTGRALGPRGLALGGEEIEGRAERLGEVALRPALGGLRLRRRPARDAGASARGLAGHGRGRAHGRRAHVRAVVGVFCDDEGRRGGRERQARARRRREQRQRDGHRQII